MSIIAKIGECQSWPSGGRTWRAVPVLKKEDTHRQLTEDAVFWLIIYLAVWLFVASLFEDRLVQVIWTLLCFGPLIKAFVDAFRKSCGKPAAKTKTPSSSAMTNRVDSGRSSSAAAPKLFSKAVPESAVRFPVSKEPLNNY